MCIAPQVSFQAPPEKKPSEPEVEILLPPSSEVSIENDVDSSKFNLKPSQLQNENEQDFEWEVNDLDDFFPSYYYLPKSKNHLILNCSPLNYSKDKPSKSFAAIAQTNLPQGNEVEKQEKRVKIPPVIVKPIPFPENKPIKQKTKKLKDSFYTHNRKKGSVIDFESNLEVLKEKFGKFLPVVILKEVFRKNDRDLQLSIRECALQIGWNLTQPLRQHDVEKTVLFQSFQIFYFYFFEESFSESKILNLLIEFNYDIERFDQYLRDIQVVINKEGKP